MKSNMLTFDTEKYNFRKLLLDSINQLDDKNLIEDLDKIHLKYGYDDIPKIEKKFMISLNLIYLSQNIVRFVKI